MRKIFLLIALFLVISCSVTRTYEIHKKYYSLGQTEQITKDIYDLVKIHNADSIPLKDWLYIGSSSENENTSKRVFSQIDKDKELVFVFTIHETKDSSFYDFSIYARIKEKR